MIPPKRIAPGLLSYSAFTLGWAACHVVQLPSSQASSLGPRTCGSHLTRPCTQPCPALSRGLVAARCWAQGSGPFGIITPQDVQVTVTRLRAAAASTTPRINSLLEQPGSVEIINGLVSQLSRRLAARAIKFVFGAQQTLALRAGGGQPTLRA
jgi:hypothetical protein